MAAATTGDWERVCRDQYDECQTQDGRIPARIERRQVSADGIPITGTGTWNTQGATCIGTPDPALPTPEQVRVAFEQIPFSKAQLKIQPVGNLTLVNLETYFEAVYPEEGFGPGEIHSTTLLGFPIQMRPLQTSLNYVYGDGTSSGATTSRGGPYPTGDIRHTYQRDGDYPTRVDTTYTGQYRIGNSDWQDIPGTVTIEGTPVQLLVCQALTRLVSEDLPTNQPIFEPNTPCSIRAAQDLANRPAPTR